MEGFIILLLSIICILLDRICSYVKPKPYIEPPSIYDKIDIRKIINLTNDPEFLSLLIHILNAIEFAKRKNRKNKSFNNKVAKAQQTQETNIPNHPHSGAYWGDEDGYKELMESLNKQNQ
jgi:hypothetical protein